MSGGVDSSTVAGLLHEAGHEVIGVTLQLYDHGAATGRKGACCAGQDIHDARRVADHLGIAHYVIDAEQRFADTAIVVTNPEVSSVRDSDRIIGLLDSKTEKAEKGQRIEKHILITRYDAQRAARGEMLTIEDVLEILSTPLLGIIPESEEVLRASNIGSPVTLNNTASAPARAYLDAARRLKGDDVPMSIPSDRKGLFDKLFGRRAA